MIILKYVLDVIMVKPHHYFAYEWSPGIYENALFTISSKTSKDTL